MEPSSLYDSVRATKETEWERWIISFDRYVGLREPTHLVIQIVYLAYRRPFLKFCWLYEVIREV